MRNLVLAVVSLYSLAAQAQPSYEDSMRVADAKINVAKHFRPYLIKDAKVSKQVSFWQQKTIPVCWENPTPQNARYREWVRQAIAGSWQRYSQLDFTCWCPCTAASKGVRIRISDEQPGIRLLSHGLPQYGSYLDGKRDALVLNFSFRKWGAQDLHTRMKGDTAAFVRAISVHEFGHVLGFAHQHERPDCYFCTEYEPMKKKAVPGIWLSGCDYYSVMNYCNPLYCNGGELTQQDKEALAAAYGSRGPGRPTPYNIAYTVTMKKQQAKKTIKASRFDFASGQQQAVPDIPKAYKATYTYYKVDLYIVSPDLAAIREVKYELQPHFNEPVVYRSNTSQNFGYSIYCWGQFKVVATVSFKNNNKPPMRLEKDLTSLKEATVKIMYKKNGTTKTISVGGRGSSKFSIGEGTPFQ